MLDRPSHSTGQNTIETALIYQGLRLDTLIRVRWLTILCQTISVFVVHFVLGFPIAIVTCLLLIGFSALVNIYTKFNAPKTPRLQNEIAGLHLAFDILQLSGLLFFTGGLQNPFAFFLLAPVLISATSLPWQHTFTLGGLVFILASILVGFHMPLPWYEDTEFLLPQAYTLSIWFSLMACLVFMASYAFRVATEARNLSAALTASELVLAREQHLSALDGMAAAAAHELGTPLSTISVVVKELERELPNDSSIRSDIELLSSQAKRCRDILSKLSSLTSESEGPMVAVRLTDMMQELAEPHRNFGIKINVTRHISVQKEMAPEVLRLPGVFYGLGSILENAVDFAGHCVTVLLAWDEDAIIIKVMDDGPGFNDGVMERLGEPYVTSRHQHAPQKSTPIEGGGLGLGIFIAKTLLERSGASIDFSNRGGDITGAEVTIMWPRESLCLM